MAAEKTRDWHYASSTHDRQGPVTTGELALLVEQGVVRPETLVWSQGYAEWVGLTEIAGLLAAEQVSRSSPPPPPLPYAAAGSPGGMAAVASKVGEVAVVAARLPSVVQEIKPRQGSFLLPRIAAAVAVAGGVGAVLFGVLVVVEAAPWPGVVLFLVASVVGVFASVVAFRKERYELDDLRVVCHRGGLLSDQVTELEVRNITHVKLRLPWLRFKFSGVGDVIVESAGNAKPVVMHAIREPEAVYAGMRERMKKNGYALTQQQVLHEESPAIIGVVIECLGLCLAAVGLSLGYIISFIATVEQDGASTLVALLVKGAVGLGVVGLIGFVIVRFLDLRRRTYRVFNDVVVYDKGFLTRHNAFIPCENIADANIKRSFLDTLFGLYDVQVSCQGSGSEIKFRRLAHGEALTAAIQQLVVLARQKPRVETRTAEVAGGASRQRSRRREPDWLSADGGVPWVADLTMSPARLLVPLVFLFPLVPIWIAVMIDAGVRLMSTRYSVRAGSVRHSVRFLSTHEREFASEKITGLVITQNLWDRLFGTMSVKFWSLGSGKALVFAHVHRSQVNLPALMRLVGIPSASPDCYAAEAPFAAMSWLRGWLNLAPLFMLEIATTVALAYLLEIPQLYHLLWLPALVVGVGLIHAKLYYARQRLCFHAHHVSAEQGIIVKKQFFVRYKNVKRIRATCYPGGHEGSLEIFAAAEEQAGASLSKKVESKSKMYKQCSFTTRLLPQIRDAGLLLDEILCGRIDASSDAVVTDTPEVLLESPRSVATAVAQNVLISVLLFPLILLLPLIVPVTILRIKRWRYRLEDSRIVISHGVFFRSETSVLIDRVDSLQQRQGPLNKLFKNGRVSIMTAGSSKPDLVVLDSPDYGKLYQEIQRALGLRG